jgi:RNA-directed DNA polymerase
MMNEREKSDRPVVPTKSPKRGYWEWFQERVEAMERRGLAKENSEPEPQPKETLCSRPRLAASPLPGGKAQPDAGLYQATDRIRQAACRDKQLRFTNLWHHVYATDRLRQAYFELPKKAAPGIDGQTWSDYGKDLEQNLQDLSQRLAKGSYRAPPAKRIYIPKADGRQRPIGIMTLEDKIVQRSTVAVLNGVYEADFKGFSYGFRPGKSAHKALDALAVAIQSRKVNYVLDADIRSFFDTLDHGWLTKFIEHRIADPRVLRHVRKWLNAGVMEEARYIEQEEGVPQGGNVSPLMANVYLHFVLDLWADLCRKRQATGEVILVRYADDFVVGFEQETDARRFLEELRERFRQFNLELHDEKTRILKFGRQAVRNGRKRDKDGQGGATAGKPSTFNFLGFTHSCGKTRRGRFIVLRRTMAKRMRAKLRVLKEELRRRMHHGISMVGRWLASVLRGHVGYYGVPRNSQPMWAFRAHLTRLWKQALSHRSQKRPVTWARMSRIAKAWLPYPRIVHPYPEDRLCVSIQGKSPVR